MVSCLSFWDSLLLPGYSITHKVTVTHPEFLILHPQPSKYWDYKYVLLCPMNESTVTILKNGKTIPKAHINEYLRQVP